LLDDSELIKWLVSYTTSNDGKLSFNDAKYLIQHAGNDQFKLKNEIDKLLAFNKQINVESIDLLVEPSINTNVFKLLDAAFIGDYEKVTEIFKQLRKNKVEIPAIIGAITWQLHVFALVKTNGSLNPYNLSKISKVHPFVIDKSTKLMASYSLSELAIYTQRFVDLCLSFANYEVDEEEALINFLNSFARQRVIS
jgi:DNA polymerase III delta subunit